MRYSNLLPKLRSISNSSSKFFVHIFLVKSEFVEHADQESILFLSVIFALVGAICNSELVKGCSIPGNFGIQSLLDEGSSLNFGLALLNLGHDSVNVLQFITPFPKDFGVLNNFLRRFSLNFLKLHNELF